MTQHTPGPWQVDTRLGGAGRIVVEGADADSELLVECPGSGGAMSYTQEICETHWKGTDEWTANAHLIAAAPDLLEALAEGMAAAKSLKKEYEAKGRTFAAQCVQNSMNKMHAANAKARGES